MLLVLVTPPCKMGLLVAKIFFMMFLGVFTWLVGLFPILGVRKGWVSESESLQTQVMVNVFSFMTCFGGGVILTSCLTHMLPDVNEVLATAIQSGAFPDSGLPVAEIFVLADLTEKEFKTNYQDIPYIPLPGSFVWRVQADGSWKFECQHGEKECLGNILEVCIMQQLNWDSDMYLPVISCMEGSDDPVSSAKGCVRDLSSLSYDAVKDCSAGKEGNKLEHSMGVKTESLDPPHKYVPWVVVNGDHTDELQEKAQSAV